MIICTSPPESKYKMKEKLDCLQPDFNMCYCYEANRCSCELSLMEGFAKAVWIPGNPMALCQQGSLRLQEETGISDLDLQGLSQGHTRKKGRQGTISTVNCGNDFYMFLPATTMSRWAALACGESTSTVSHPWLDMTISQRDFKSYSSLDATPRNSSKLLWKQDPDVILFGYFLVLLIPQEILMC